MERIEYIGKEKASILEKGVQKMLLTGSFSVPTEWIKLRYQKCLHED